MTDPESCSFIKAERIGFWLGPSSKVPKLEEMALFLFISEQCWDTQGPKKKSCQPIALLGGVQDIFVPPLPTQPRSQDPSLSLCRFSNISNEIYGLKQRLSAATARAEELLFLRRAAANII